jgi:hypothetical protein
MGVALSPQAGRGNPRPYILAFNGIPSGNQKLEPDVRVLEQIIIDIPSG